MQVVILCGGQGTRIRDVAENIPKPMIPIGGRPILWHIMKGFAQQGFADFVLCLGYQSWVIKRFFLEFHLAESDFSINLGDSGRVQVHAREAQEAWTVTMAETGLNVMTGCRIKRIEKYITGDHFLLTYGDGLANIDVDHLVDFHLRHGKTATVTVVRPPSRFGEVELDGSRVVEFNEKPLLARQWISGGFFVLHRRIFDRLEDDAGLVFEHGPLTQLARDGELIAHRHTGFWHAMDSSRDYRYLNELWERGEAPWQESWEAPPLWAAA